MVSEKKKYFPFFEKKMFFLEMFFRKNFEKFLTNFLWVEKFWKKDNQNFECFMHNINFRIKISSKFRLCRNIQNSGYPLLKKQFSKKHFFSKKGKYFFFKKPKFLFIEVKNFFSPIKKLFLSKTKCSLNCPLSKTDTFNLALK